MENTVKRPNVMFLLVSFVFIIASIILGIFLGMQYQRNITVNTNTQDPVQDQNIVVDEEDSTLQENQGSEIGEETQQVNSGSQTTPIAMKRFNYEQYNISFDYPASLGEPTTRNDGYEGALTVRFSQSKLAITLHNGFAYGDIVLGVENAEILLTESFMSKRGERVDITVYTCTTWDRSNGICIWMPFLNDGILFYATQLSSLEEAKEYIQIVKQIDSSLTSGVSEYYNNLNNR